MRSMVVLGLVPVFQVGGRLLAWGLLGLGARAWHRLTQRSGCPPSWRLLPGCLWGGGGSLCSLGPVALSVLGGLARCLPRQLLQHECPHCPERPPFSLFGDLEQHMRKQHELFCCKLCLRHLQVSPPGCLPGPPPHGAPPLPLTPQATRQLGPGPSVPSAPWGREGREAGELARAQRPFPADLHARAEVVLAQGPGSAPHAGGP